MPVSSTFNVLHAEMCYGHSQVAVVYSVLMEARNVRLFSFRRLVSAHSRSLNLSENLPSPHSHLLPRYYQDRTNQPHLCPLPEYPVVWFLGRLGCRR